MKKRSKMQNKPKLLRTQRSGATVNKRRNQSGDAHRALQPIYGMRKNQERIKMSEELRDKTQCAPVEKTCKKANGKMLERSRPDYAG
jgi:hypothetical protein